MNGSPDRSALEPPDLRGVVVGRLAGRSAGLRASGGGDQDHASRAFRPVLGEGLRDDAPQGMPDDVRLLHAQRVEQQLMS